MGSATTDAPLQFWDMLARLQPACMIATGAHDMALWPLDASQVTLAGQRIRIEGLAAAVAMGDLATVTFIDEAGAAFVSVAGLVAETGPGRVLHLRCVEAEVAYGEQEPFRIRLSDG